MNARLTHRLCGIVAAVALLAAACSSGDSPRTSQQTSAPATTGVETAPKAEDAAASSTTAARPSDEPAGEAPTTTTSAVDLEPVVVTITDGPTGTTTGRDEHGEGGIFEVAWGVSPADATCSYSLIDVNGNDAVYRGAESEGVVENLSGGESERNLKVPYIVAPDGLPITINISCRTDDGASAAISETVRIVEPGEESDATDSASTEQTKPETTEPKFEIVRWDRAELEALFSHCPPPYEGDADGWAKWFAHYDEYTEAYLAGRSVAPKWPQPTTSVLPALYARISKDGYRTSDDASEWVTAEGIVPQRDISHMSQPQIAGVLHDWMSYRYQFAPEGDHAPAAWGLRIVAGVSSLSCVANTMRNACDHNDLTHWSLQSPHKRYDADSSSLGRALWSIVCGQAPTTERLGDDS